MRIAVIGAGFVGTTTAVAFAEAGHDVQLIESDPGRRERLAGGTLPFHEEGLEDAYRSARSSGRLEVRDTLSAALPPDVAYVTVGTPQGPNGSADLEQVKQATRDIAKTIARVERYVVVAVKSTVPPGTTQNVVRPILDELTRGRPYGLVMAPEFLREGSALEDARRPSRIVIGASDERAAEVMRHLHRGSPSPLLTVSPDAAEMIKYVSNALLATKIAFADEMAALAERLHLDIDEVMAAVGLDPRISPHFLQAGLGFGGSCFPKDVAALQAVAEEYGVPSTILRAVLAHNEVQPMWAVETAERVLGDLAGKRIALLGLAFKPGTSDVRETRARPIHDALVARGAEVVCYDPVAGDAFRELVGNGVRVARSTEEAVTGADAMILQTAWPEFREIDPRDLVAAMRTPVVLDGRRALDPRTHRKAGIDYHGLGNGKESTHESSDPRSRTRHAIPASD